MNKKPLLRTALAASLLLPTLSHAIDFTGIPYVTYGDGNSYSLPISQLIDEELNGGCTGPGCDFYVPSTPGAIKDLVVLGTGSDGGPVTTNYEGQDKAYATPNSSGINFFSTPTELDPGESHPGAKKNPPPIDIIKNNYAETWDASLLSLDTFLGTGELVFYFNNNQEKSLGTVAESLAAWAQVWITDAAGNLVDLDGNAATSDVLEFTNNDSLYALVSEGGGGVFNGNPLLYNSSVTDPLANDPDSNNGNTDYVLSGGQICLTEAFVPVACDDSSAFYPAIDHNLGANEAAYAIIFPELNAGMTSLFGSLTPEQLAHYTLHVDYRLGCDPALYPGVDGNPNNGLLTCTGASGPDTLLQGKNLNNGYEQLFIASTTSIIQVPEPGTLVLLGSGLLGMALTRRKRRRTGR